MRFYALFLDDENRIVSITHRLPPWKAAASRRARSVLELAAGECERLGHRRRDEARGGDAMSAVATAEPRASWPTRARAAVIASTAAGAFCLLLAEPSAVGAVEAFAVAVLVWLAAIDLEFRLVSNRFVLPATAVVLMLVAILEPSLALELVLAAVGSGALLFVAALVRPGGLVMGDVKLGLLLGAILGSAVVTALVVGFCAVGLVGVAFAVRSGRKAFRQVLPLAPFLALGALVALVLRSPV